MECDARVVARKSKISSRNKSGTNWDFASSLKGFREPKRSIMSRPPLCSSLLSTDHDRLRRNERGIQKDDLLLARRYGMVEDGKWNGSKKYTHAGKVFIYDERRNKAITSWKIDSKMSSKISGTTVADPILLQKSSEHDNGYSIKMHNRVKNYLIAQKHLWRSHSVLVIDMSGSMRRDDVNGARCRSDGVFTVIARDFIKHRLETGEFSIFDFISIVIMKEEPEIICFFEPIDFVLFNKLVDMREWTTVKPEGPGMYLPALIMAEKLLAYNDKAKHLSLLFFSDGKPSDPKPEYPAIVARMGEIASRYGRRLVVSCIGMADPTEDFSVLKKMIDEVNSFHGCKAFFNKPNLSTDALSSIMTVLSSSMTATQTELTDLRSGKIRSVRTDLKREHKNAPDDSMPGDDWRIFLASSSHMFPINVFKWNNKQGDFSLFLDPRCVLCYQLVASPQDFIPKNGVLCGGCKACFICFQCRRRSTVRDTHNCDNLKQRRRYGLLSTTPLPSFSVALKKSAFGEGAERVAFKFRFLDETGRHFVGTKMVAKESRFVAEESKSEAQYLESNKFGYHQQFARTQALASRFAKIYNRALDKELPNSVQSGKMLQKLKEYPRIHFLEPLIFELGEQPRDDSQLKIYNILVEPMLEGEFRKYNNNNGEVCVGVTPKILESPSIVSNEILGRDIVDFLTGRRVDDAPSAPVTLKNKTSFCPTGDMNIIEEGSDEDDESSEDEESTEDEKSESRSSNRVNFDTLIVENADLQAPTQHNFGNIADSDFAQAFSHFSYVRSGGKIMIVDLQGILRVNDDGTRAFIFTDPAVHRRKRLSEHFRHVDFGRTNRGTKGMRAFFNTHVCNDACRLLGLRPREKKNNEHFLHLKQGSGA
jgi:hypothetical protein